jgi:hypothetical protein
VDAAQVPPGTRDGQDGARRSPAAVCLVTVGSPLAHRSSLLRSEAARELRSTGHVVHDPIADLPRRPAAKLHEPSSREARGAVRPVTRRPRCRIPGTWVGAGVQPAASLDQAVGERCSAQERRNGRPFLPAYRASAGAVERVFASVLEEGVHCRGRFPRERCVAFSRKWFGVGVTPDVHLVTCGDP